jgi:hypothetical protein
MLMPHIRFIGAQLPPPPDQLTHRNAQMVLLEQLPLDHGASREWSVPSYWDTP